MRRLIRQILNYIKSNIVAGILVLLARVSQTDQQLILPLYDKAGRELLVEVTYSKREADTIRYLEKIVTSPLLSWLEERRLLSSHLAPLR